MTTAIRSIPDRRSPLGLDIALEVQRHGILRFFESTWHRHGDMARVQIGPQVIFLVVHPDHVRRISVDKRDTYAKEASYEIVRQLLVGDGLLTSTGALGRRQRKQMAH